MPTVNSGTCVCKKEAHKSQLHLKLEFMVSHDRMPTLVVSLDNWMVIVHWLAWVSDG